MTSRQLKNTPLNKSSFFWINSESQNVTGTNNAFSYDISQTPLDKNKAYNLIIKSITYPNNSPQITTAYNYNSIAYQVIRADTGALQTTRTITLQEGTYDSAQLVFNLASLLNTDFASLAYGDDTYTVIYSDITNRITFRRESKTAVGGIYYDIVLLANDTLSKYNGEPGFGLAFVLGLAYDGTLRLPSEVGNTNAVSCPNPPNLQPYLYFSILLDGVNNYNHSSDTPSVNNIVYRCPLTIGSGRYSYVYIEENNPDFGQLYVSTLPSRLSFRLVDQYGNLFPTAENSAVDITIKLVPLE